MTTAVGESPAFSLRAPQREDLAAVVALMRTCDEIEFGRPDTDDADVLSEWGSTGFSLDDDALLAVEADEAVGQRDRAARRSETAPQGADDVRERVVGYAQVFEGHAEVVVHPRRNGKGIGTALRLFTEERALRQADEAAARGDKPSGSSPAPGEVKIWQAPRQGNRTAHRLLEAAGYARGHHYAQMERELDAALPEPVWPAGVVVRTFEPGRDEAACHNLQNLAWGQYDTYEPITFARWTDMTREPDFDPSLWFVAELRGGIIGLCLSREYGDIGWVTSLGVLPDARGHGLGEALLRHSFSALRARGVRLVGLSVSSRTVQSAWRLYERVGMRDAGGWVAYEKALHSAG